MRQRNIAAEIFGISSEEGQIFFHAFRASNFDPFRVDCFQNSSNSVSLSSGFEIFIGEEESFLWLLSFRLVTSGVPRDMVSLGKMSLATGGAAMSLAGNSGCW